MAAMGPKRHAALLLPLVLLSTGCLSAEPARAPDLRLRLPSTASDDPRLRQSVLTEHNRARAEVGVPPLDWSDALASAARDYAREMARTGRFAHSPQKRGSSQGENLFAGTRGAYGYEEMVRLWIEERRDFVNRPTPHYSRTGRWQDVTHYAQVVWRGTRSVGCAVASGGRDDFLVCRYAPTGDVIGQRAY